MIDAEIVRLRRLRHAALQARALAVAVRREESRRDALCERTAVACWRIARAITGHLRSHPYKSYQSDAHPVRCALDRAIAWARAAAAHDEARRVATLQVGVARLARALDDVRAVTRTPDLSDTLARSQEHIRRLVKELSVEAHDESEQGLMPNVAPASSHGTSLAL